MLKGPGSSLCLVSAKSSLKEGEFDRFRMDNPAVTKNDVASGFGFRHFRLCCHRLSWKMKVLQI